MDSIINMELWNYFIDAYHYANVTEGYGAQYPWFRHQMETEGLDKIIRHKVGNAIASGLDPTKCLYGVLSCNLGDASRYALEEGRHVIVYAVETLMKAGAKFPYESLFEMRTHGSIENQYDLADEVQDYEVRGILIDFLKPDLAKTYADWKSINPRDFHEITEFSEIGRLQHLKYYSKYLQSL